MFTSVTEAGARRASRIYLAVSAACAVFGAVYEIFSFGVLSFYMIFCFLPPLLLGAVPFLILRSGRFIMPNNAACCAYNSAVSSLTVGFIFKGIIAIYGTTNILSNFYFAASAVLLFLSLILYAVGAKKQKAIEKEKSI
ncbi:MAG: hypothetical protein J5879_09240 [Clostridia bacterium]|nr:hypothetical protein [Clostridia bacterium]